MDKDLYYALPEELRLVLIDMCPAGFVFELASRNGIFIDLGLHKDYSEFLSLINWDYETIREIHLSSLRSSQKQSLSGFWLKVDTKNELEFPINDFSILSIIADKVGNLPMGDKRITLTNPIIRDTNDTEFEQFEGEVEYKQKKKGRTLFLEDVERSFKYYIEEKDNGHYQILVDLDSSNDTKVFEDWLYDVIKSIDKNIICEKDGLDPEDLRTSKLVEFFDQLATKTMPGWQIIDIVKIIVKQQANGDSEGEELSRPKVEGITKAILEGGDLRHNPFVQECEESGYKFMAMTYKFRHNSNPYEISISAEFKERPKVFEINIADYKKIQGKDAIREDHNLLTKERNQILHGFYRMAKNIYDNLVSGITS